MMTSVDKFQIQMELKMGMCSMYDERPFKLFPSQVVSIPDGLNVLLARRS